MNTRLQVEHPVTELVTGLDLVRLQLLVAQGQPLPPEALLAGIEGHAVEARLYAEDVPAGYLPATGTLHLFEIPPGVRVDSGVETGSVVSPYYDAMLAKVVAHGATREEACARLAGALERTKVHGVTTNRDLLVRVLRSKEFLAGEVDTGYLDRVDPAEIGSSPLRDDDRRLHAVAAALAGAARRRQDVPLQLPSGWRSVPSSLQLTSYDDLTVGYAFRRDGVAVEVDGEQLAVDLVAAQPDLVVLAVDGVHRRIAVHQVGQMAYVDSALGSSVFVERPRFPEPCS